MNHISFDELIDIVDKEKPVLFGIISSGSNPSSSTMVMAGIVDFFEIFTQRKLLGVKTFIWGSHPTVLPERTLKETNANFIIRGEGYQSIEELYKCLLANGNLDNVISISRMVKNNFKTEFIHNKFAPLVDVEQLPMIDWEMMNPSKYKGHNWHCFGDLDNRTPYAIIWTSFGCPFPCNFCCINNLFGKRTQRFRKIDSVISEISILVEKYNVRHLKVLDELFVTHPNRIEEFCDKLEKKGFDLNMWSYSRVDTINRKLLKKLKKVGMNWISYGFETATTEILKDTKKGTATYNVDDVIKMTHDEGVHICADVMFGLEDEDLSAMQRTYDFLVHYNFEWGNMYQLFAYPGTELFGKIQQQKSWKEYSLYGYECKPAGTKHLTPAEVLRFRDEAFLKYHSRPEYLSMIEDKFGVKTKEHIIRMVKHPLRRKILEG